MTYIQRVGFGFMLLIITSYMLASSSPSTGTFLLVYGASMVGYFMLTSGKDKHE